MVTRFVIDIPGIILIAYITEKLLNEKEKLYIYEQAGNVECERAAPNGREIVVFKSQSIL